MTNAMVVPEAAAQIPSSFSNSDGSRGHGFIRNPATARLVDAVRIFSRSLTRERNFDYDSSRGITYPSADLKAPSLGELIVIASVDPSRYIGQDGRSIRSDNANSLMDFSPDPEQRLGTIRDLARALLNRSRSALPNDGQPAGNEQEEQTGAYKYFEVFMETELDKELLSTVVDVVSPSVTPNGLVALNLFGARDFAFMTSPESNKIQIVDFATGTTLTINQGETVRPIRSVPATTSAKAPTRPVRTSLSTPLLVRVIAAIRAVAVHPLTYLSLGLIVAWAFVYRVIRRSAEA